MKIKENRLLCKLRKIRFFSTGSSLCDVYGQLRREEIDFLNNIFIVVKTCIERCFYKYF